MNKATRQTRALAPAEPPHADKIVAHGPPEEPLDGGTLAAAATSAAVIAQQVAGKAIRDAFYLSHFDVSTLPRVMILSGVLSLLSILMLSRLITRMTPQRVLPWMFFLSAGGLVFEWVVALASPRLAAIGVYVHTSVISPLLITAFWSHINERFDPYSAKRAVARIAGGGTLGGLLGALATWRAAAFVTVTQAVLFLAALNFACTVGAFVMCKKPLADELARNTPAPIDAEDTGIAAPFRVLRGAPFLRNLALLVAGGAAISSLLDYVFTAQATAAYGKGPALLAFFSLFGLAVGVASLAVQVVFGRVATEKLSLVVNVGLLPGIILLGGGFGLAVPGLTSASLLRGTELVYRNTLFRSAYELLYTPIAPGLKRTTKAVVDVGFDRLGTIVGGGLTAIAIFTIRPQSVALGVVLVLALLASVLIRYLHHGYIDALEEGLREGAKRLESASTSGRFSLVEERAREKLYERANALGLRPKDHGRATLAARNSVALVRAAGDLASGNVRRARAALADWETNKWPLTAFAIVLLGHRELYLDARNALIRGSKETTGQLVDALLDPNMDAVVRRRLPRVLAESGSQTAADGMLRAMSDARFEVRYACGRALFTLTENSPEIVLSHEKVLATAIAEAKRVEEAEKTANEDEPATDDDLATRTLVDVMMRERIARNLEHVFTVLALIMEREPLRICLRALHHDDPRHRGTALEYLQTVLPGNVRDAMWPLIGDVEATIAAPRPATEILAELRSVLPQPQLQP